MTKASPVIFYEISDKESQHIIVFKLLLTVMLMFIHSYITPLNFAGGEEQTLAVSGIFATIQYTVSQCFSRCTVPGFFMISAILFYRKSVVWYNNLWLKFKSLLLPYIILNTFWILVYAAAQKIPVLTPYFARSDRLISTWGWQQYMISYCLDPLPYHLWFLRDLFLLNVFAWVVGKIADSAPKTFLALLSLFWIFAADGEYCQNMQSLCFWGIGCCMVKLNLHLEMVSRLNRRIFYPAYLLLVVLDVYLLRFGGYCYLTVHKLMMMTGVLFWYDVVMMITAKGVPAKILYIASFSYGIFLLHEMGLSFTKKIVTRLLPATAVSALLQYLLIPFLITGICLTICIMMKRFVPRLYALLTGNRQR